MALIFQKAILIHSSKAQGDQNISATERIVKEATALGPSEKARLIDQLIFSLDRPGAQIDRRWSDEAKTPPPSQKPWPPPQKMVTK